MRQLAIQGNMEFKTSITHVMAGLAMSLSVHAQTLLGEEPALGSVESRITQAEIVSGALSLADLRLSGLKIFATQFRASDGYGDGPVNPADTTSPGGRPTLQNNGSFLRVNGLDSQSCLACHTVVSAASMPMVLGVGGAGTINNSAMFMTRNIDVADNSGNGFAAFDGRLINPPALFGAGGVQLVAKEMTVKLQQLKRRAINNPGRSIRLRANGVDFGSVVADESGVIDPGGVEGVDPDLVVRPFGRKGEFATVRDFDLGALMFHLGIEPVEVIGENNDGDGDGVVNELFIGEVSALDIFVTTMEAPVQTAMDAGQRKGNKQFHAVGCAGCHKPDLRTSGSLLTYSQPEIADDPSQNVFYVTDLAESPAMFSKTRRGGIIVPMFSDLKRHDMGDDLAEDFHGTDVDRNREYITAKLWGVADTAPYLHDGRAFTLNSAIMMHGGEAESVRNAYAVLSVGKKNDLISFLMTLRNPESPNEDVLN
jgi:hypothetical protein